MARNAKQPRNETDNLIQDMPFISLILPFNPKMTPKAIIAENINHAVQKIKNELNGRYAGMMVELVLEKLDAAVSSLNYSTHKNSIALYISPVFEKLLYLDIEVEEKISVDKDFAIRDVVASKNLTKKVLLVALSDERIRIYLANSDTLTGIVATRLEEDNDCNRTGEVDNTLDLLLPAYHLPVMVAGSSVQCQTFMKHTRHSGGILEYITTDSREPGDVELHRLLSPFISDMELLYNKEIFKRLQRARHGSRLTTGIDNIVKQGAGYNGSLLLVEKGYIHEGFDTEGNDKAASMAKRFSPVKDAVDNMIEKALVGGGDVAFVNTGVLPHNEHIALIQQVY